MVTGYVWCARIDRSFSDHYQRLFRAERTRLESHEQRRAADCPMTFDGAAHTVSSLAHISFPAGVG